MERSNRVTLRNCLLTRAGVKGNRKLILVLIQERTRLLVSGRIESSAFSLSLNSCSFSLAFSLVLLPSFFLSLLLVLAFLPSLRCNTFVGQMHSEQKSAHSAVTVRICIIVRSRKNLHTCKLPLAGSRSPLVKYRFPLYKPDTFVRASNGQVRYLHTVIPLLVPRFGRYDLVNLWG